MTVRPLEKLQIETQITGQMVYEDLTWPGHIEVNVTQLTIYIYLYPPGRVALSLLTLYQPPTHPAILPIIIIVWILKMLNLTLDVWEFLSALLVKLSD